MILRLLVAERLVIVARLAACLVGWLPASSAFLLHQISISYLSVSSIFLSQ
jgi:hypothetical protein